MRKFKVLLLKNTILRAVIVALSTTIILWGVSLIPHDNSWANWRSLIYEKIDFNDLFFSFHRRIDSPSLNGRRVFVMDISEYQTREDLKLLFDSLSMAKPYMVALDIIFPNINNALIDTTINQHLVKSIEKLPNVVLATELRQGQLLRSFFAEEAPEVTEGIANLSNSIIRKWDVYQHVNEDTLLTFATVIAQKMGALIPDNGCEWLIDYSIQDTVVFRPHARNFNWNCFRDQVVIVGDINDIRDTRIVPVTFCTSTRMQGVFVHKQIVQTIISHNWFHKIPDIWEWVIIFLFLVCLLLVNPFVDWMDAGTKKAYRGVGARINMKFFKKKNDTVPNKGQPVSVLETKEKYIRTSFCKSLVFLLMFGVAYILFWRAHLYMNLVRIILVAPAFLWVGNRLLNLIDNRRFS